MSESDFNYNQFSYEVLNQDYQKYLQLLQQNLDKDKKDEQLQSMYFSQLQNNNILFNKLQIIEALFDQIFTYSTDIENAQYYNKEISLQITRLLQEYISRQDYLDNDYQIQQEAKKIFEQIQKEKDEYFKIQQKELGKSSKLQVKLRNIERLKTNEVERLNTKIEDEQNKLIMAIKENKSQQEKIIEFQLLVQQQQQQINNQLEIIENLQQNKDLAEKQLKDYQDQLNLLKENLQPYYSKTQELENLLNQLKHNQKEDNTQIQQILRKKELGYEQTYYFISQKQIIKKQQFSYQKSYNINNKKINKKRIIEYAQQNISKIILNKNKEKNKKQLQTNCILFNQKQQQKQTKKQSQSTQEFMVDYQQFLRNEIQQQLQQSQTQTDQELKKLQETINNQDKEIKQLLQYKVLYQNLQKDRKKISNALQLKINENNDNLLKLNKAKKTLKQSKEIIDQLQKEKRVLLKKVTKIEDKFIDHICQSSLTSLKNQNQSFSQVFKNTENYIQSSQKKQLTTSSFKSRNNSLISKKSSQSLFKILN